MYSIIFALRCLACVADGLGPRGYIENKQHKDIENLKANSSIRSPENELAVLLLRMASPIGVGRSPSVSSAVPSKRRKVSGISNVAMGEDSGEMDDASISEKDMDLLRKRIDYFRQQGNVLSTERLVDLATSRPPWRLIDNFFREESRDVVETMHDSVIALFGDMPTESAKFEMTHAELAPQFYQLQMTGYMLRNAEYALSLRKLFRLKTRSIEECREAFDRIDVDKKGYIETKDIEGILKESSDARELVAFKSLLDKNGDGHISWDEFSAALGVRDASPFVPGASMQFRDVDEPRIPITGNITLTYKDGSAVEMDASAYEKQLTDQLRWLKTELAQYEQQEVIENGKAASLAAYVESLPDAQLRVLTSGISDTVMSTMRRLAKFPWSPAMDVNSVNLGRFELMELCLHKLVLGYRLRDVEVLGAEFPESLIA